MEIVRKMVLPMCLLILLGSLAGCQNNKETVTIRYAAWNLGDPEKNSLERRMIQAFMDKYPQIRVEIEEDFVKNYDKSMKSAASDNTIPDVFMYVGNPQANTNGWCADLSGIVERDREWGNVPRSLREATLIRGKTIAVPSTIYFYGYFCNTSLFEARQENSPTAGFTPEQFEKAVSVMTNIEKGSMGLADESSIIEWYPAAVNPMLGWFSWDGGKFSLNSAEFKDGVKLAREIYGTKRSFVGLTAEEKGKLNGANDWEAWNAGTVAMKFDGTWAVNDYLNQKFKVSFAGLPGGRVCIVPDFLFISKNCSHTKEAYQFVKFMSAYSKEGFSKRMEIAQANDLIVSTIPMVKDKKLINTYFRNINMDGIREAYNRMDQDSYIEGTKVLPGYIQARWEYATSITADGKENASMGEVLTGTFRGDVMIDDVADQLNSAANECVQIFPKPANN